MGTHICTRLAKPMPMPMPKCEACWVAAAGSEAPILGTGCFLAFPIPHTHLILWWTRCDVGARDSELMVQLVM